MHVSFLTQLVVVLYFVPGISPQATVNTSLLWNHTETCNNTFDVRLIDGTSVNHAADVGRVEVCLDGTWGRVCDDGWDVNDATTVCTQLGHNVTGIPTRRSFYSTSVNASSHLTNAQCRSNDTKLSDCDIDRTGVNNSCDQSEQAGVVCLQGPNCTKDGEVQLNGGMNETEGRVEFCFGGFWWEVCDNGWDEVDAKVVCSQLGYGNTNAVVMNTFGTRSLAVLLRNVNCNSSHTELSQCVSPEEMFAVLRKRSSCGLNNRAGVKCVECVTTAPNTVFTNGGSSSAVSGTVIGAVIGVLAVVIIVIIVIVIIVVVVVVVTKRREKSKEPLGQEKTGPVRKPQKIDNVTYISTTLKELKNPIYSGADDAPNAQPLNVYDTIYSDPETKVVVNTLYQTVDDADVPAGGVTNGGRGQNGVNDDHFYSALGATGADAQPHNSEQQPPPDQFDTGYSRLQHK